MPVCLCLSVSLSLSLKTDRETDGRTDGRTDRHTDTQMDGQKTRQTESGKGGRVTSFKFTLWCTLHYCFRYEFIGQNALSLTVDTPHIHTLTVPEEERIAVKTGDIIAVLYGSKSLGVTYSLCDGSDNPESDNVYWFEPLTPDTAEQGKAYSFSYTPVWLCGTFSFRAVVTQVVSMDCDLCDVKGMT